jgi:cytochrome c oxidase subunit 2
MFWIPVAAAESGKFMPLAVTDIAKQVDSLYMFLLVSSLISCVILLGGMLYFVIKYRRKTEDQKTAYITHNATLEFLWSFIPFVIFMVVFAWGWIIYHDMRVAPANALEVEVTGVKWGWSYTYRNGKTSDELIVPVDTPVKLIMRSKDVLHSFFIPSMRIKQDVIPGRYTSMWFESKELGEFTVFCTEYCGAGHSAMVSKVRVVTEDEYEQWLAVGFEGLALYEKGEKLFAQKQCVGCHTTDGRPSNGPSLRGIFGSKRVIADGTEVTADENYLRESILYPNAKVHMGYSAGLMPAFQGQMSEDDLSAVISYLKKL